MTDRPEFDRGVLLELERKVGANVVTEIIDLFCEHSPQNVERFQRGLEAGDLHRSAEALHSIRGSAVMLGAHQLADVSLIVETLARKDDAEGVRRTSADFEQAHRRAVTYLTQWKNRRR